AGKQEGAKMLQPKGRHDGRCGAGLRVGNRSNPGRNAVAGLAICWLLGAARTWAADAPMPKPLTVDADGSVHVPAMTVPVSSYLSPQGKAYLAEHLKQVQRPEMLVQTNGIPPLLAGYLT